LRLSLSDAIDRGVRQNLALLLGEQGTRASRAQRLRTLSDLLPNVSARTAETAEQVNLAALGVPPSLLPGISPIVGPFGIFDARATYSQRLFDWKVIQNTRSAGENVKAAQLSYKDTRELVVLVVTNLYLQEVQGRSRVEVARAQVDTAKAVYQQAVDLERAGVAARIDVLRAQVEMQAQQVRLLSAENDLDKQELALARAIGLAVGQPFASIGIAMVTTMLARKQQVHVNQLGEHVTNFDATARQMISAIQQGLMSRGSDAATAARQAQAAVWGMVQQHAAMMSYNDVFFLLAVLFAVMLPLILLMRKPQHQGGDIAVH
jgi:hypothetical protein